MKEVFSTICLIGFVQALFLSLVLFVKKRNRRANRFFSLIMLFIALDLLEEYFTIHGYYTSMTVKPMSIIPYSYIYGPTLFLYSSFLISKIKRFTKNLFLLYIPFIAALIINILTNFISKIPSAPDPGIEIGNYINIVVNGIGLLYELFFYMLAYFYLHQYTVKLKEYFSDINRIQLLWLRVILAVLSVIEIIVNILYWQDIHGRDEIGMLDFITLIWGLALIFIIAFFAIIQPEIFTRIKIMIDDVPDLESIAAPKYEKLRLPASKEEYYVKELAAYMSKEKPYLEEEFTLQDLADALSITKHQLSMILNIHLKQNFYIFVNTYRVEVAKKLLVDFENKNRNILSIAYSAGFNSKSTFNAMFKKLTGKTPKEYRKEFLNQ